MVLAPSRVDYDQFFGMVAPEPQSISPELFEARMGGRPA